MYSRVKQTYRYNEYDRGDMKHSSFEVFELAEANVKLSHGQKCKKKLV